MITEAYDISKTYFVIGLGLGLGVTLTLTHK